MQAFQHTMAHRGPGATRPNARWHPYTPPRSCGYLPTSVGACNYAPQTSQQNPSQNQGYLLTPSSAIHPITPASSSYSQSPLSLVVPQKTQPKILNPSTIAKTQLSRTSDQPLVAVALLEQTVKSLTDIWRPECIPPIFLKNHRFLQPTNSQHCFPEQTTHYAVSQQLNRKSNYLPSPCSPTTSKPAPISSQLPQQTDQTHAASFFGALQPTGPFAGEELLPIRRFVKEVVLRSRVSRTVLESALCYVEAVRKKVPELVEQEKQGLGVRGEPELGDRITHGADEHHVSSNFDDLLSDSTGSDQLKTELLPIDSNVSTVLQVDASLPACDMQVPDGAHKRRKVPAQPLPPLVPLPSPLLCPRRTFLAALILASKFIQDRCYSNRAWAKLSGLPPREVGRCERALGEALEWRLWVGKGTTFGESANRGVSRCRSESALTFGSTALPQNATHMPSPPLSDASASPEFGRVTPALQSGNRSLRRASTLPDASAFRCVPPRYRQPGSLPFAFSGPSVPPQFASSSCAQVPGPAPRALRAEPTMILSDELVPRTLSPLSSTETTTLSTPSTVCGWSPAQSTTSTDSSDSGSSIGSIATPVDMAKNNFGRNGFSSDAGLLSSIDMSLIGHDCAKLESFDAFSRLQIGSVDAMENWYSQVLSSNALYVNNQLPMLGSMETIA